MNLIGHFFLVGSSGGCTLGKLAEAEKPHKMNGAYSHRVNTVSTEGVGSPLSCFPRIT